jgi:hypothetical protein
VSKAVKRIPEPHEDDFVDHRGRMPWKEIRRWEAGDKPSDIFSDPELLLPWRKQKQITEQQKD